MKSMTGFGYSQFQNDKIDITAEIKSYNNRYLELNINIPPFLSPLEPFFRNYLTSRIDRGKVEFYLRVKELEEDVEILIDKNSAAAGIKAFQQLSEIAGIESTVKLSDLLKIDGIIKKVKNRDAESFKELILPVVEDGYIQFDCSRCEEGKKTEADIIQQIDVILSALKVAEQYAAEMESDIKKNLKARFYELLGDKVDESRVYAETAIMLVKYSINEEIVRLKSHIDSFMSEIKKGKPSAELPIGKKLDFICQEMNREINTIGSKSFKVEVNQAVINARDALEKVREQIRNIA